MKISQSDKSISISHLNYGYVQIYEQRLQIEIIKRDYLFAKPEKADCVLFAG